MILPLLLFILDLFLLHYVQYTFNLILFFLLFCTIKQKSIEYMSVVFFLLLIEDFLTTNIVGITFLYAIPTIIIAQQGLVLFSKHPYLVFIISSTIGIFNRHLILYLLTGISNYTQSEISGIILIIVIILIYTLQGRSGNRPYIL